MFPMTPLQSWAFLVLVAMLIVNVVVLWNELAIRVAARIEPVEDIEPTSELSRPTTSSPQPYDHERDGI